MDISPVAGESGTIPKITPAFNNTINVEGLTTTVTETLKAKKRLEYAENFGEQSKPIMNGNSGVINQSPGIFKFGMEKKQPVSYAYSFEALLKQEGNGSGFLSQLATIEPLVSAEPHPRINGLQVEAQLQSNGPDDSLLFASNDLTPDTGRPNLKFWKRRARTTILDLSNGLDGDSLKKRQGVILPDGARKRVRMEEENPNEGSDVSVEVAEQPRREP